MKRRGFSLPTLFTASIASLLASSIVCGGGRNSVSGLDLPIRTDLYKLQEAEVKAQEPSIEDLSLQTIAEVDSHVFESVPGRRGALSREEAQDVLDDLVKADVIANIDSVYDPDGSIGFCFGKAAWVHLELLRRGLNKRAIKKSFLIGTMKAGPIYWQFHVATIVKAEGDGWWVIDKNVYEDGKKDKPHVVSLSEWFKYWKVDSTDGNLRLYVTRPQKIGASSWEYNIRPGGLFHSSYNGFFKDMFRAFKDFPIRVEKSFKPKTCQDLFKIELSGSSGERDGSELYSPKLKRQFLMLRQFVSRHSNPRTSVRFR